MRSLATFTSSMIMLIGSIVAFAFLVLGFVGLEDNAATGFGFFAIGVGVFLSASATACILALLASIDLRLSALQPQSGSTGVDRQIDQSKDDLAGAMFTQSLQLPR